MKSGQATNHFQNFCSPGYSILNPIKLSQPLRRFLRLPGLVFLGDGKRGERGLLGWSDDRIGHFTIAAWDSQLLNCL